MFAQIRASLVKGRGTVLDGGGIHKSNNITTKDTSEVKGDPAQLRSALSDRFTSFPSQKVRLRSLTLSSLRMTHTVWFVRT